MVRIVKTQVVSEYIRSHANCKNILEAWVSIVQASNWSNPLDIVTTFGSNATDILGKKDNKPSTLPPNRVVINVGGNTIRVIAKYQFHEKQKMAWLFIKFIGTHAEYTKLCEANGQYDVDMYK